MFKNLILVGLGGCIGSMARYLVIYFYKSVNFPTATLLVNVTGSFVIGIIIGLSIKQMDFSEDWKIFLATGICGGFTTFSAFSMENLQLLQQGKYGWCLFYITVSMVAGIAAAWLGFKLSN